MDLVHSLFECWHDGVVPALWLNWYTDNVNELLLCVVDVAWDTHGTSPAVNKRLTCMSLTTGSVSGECHRTVKTSSAGCQSHRQTHSDHTHCQWRHLDCWWRQGQPNNWHCMTQTAMNSAVFVCLTTWIVCLTTWTHITPWSHQLEHLLSVTATHNWGSITSVKSAMKAKYCVSSAVHSATVHSPGLVTLPLTHKETYL